MGKLYGTLEGGREVLLTFDDGPHPTWTPRLLDCLAQENIKGVFFVLGQRVATTGGRAIVERVFREGHRIGSHSYSHPDLTKLSEAAVRKELVDTEKLIGEFLTSNKLFRPPYGAHSSTVDRVVKELGYTMMLWTVDSNDWRTENRSSKWISPSVKTIGDRGHSIFLCHDIHKTTVENVPAFVAAVRKLPKANFIAYV